jgi:hypothetical protein
MQQVRGQVVHCGRFGCVVRLEDGRFGLLPAAERGVDELRRALAAGRRPSFPFLIAQDAGGRVRLRLHGAASVLPPADDGGSSAHEASTPAPPQKFSASLEQKIIDFWRQVSEWDRNAGRVETDDLLHRKTERLLPFEERAPRRYKDLPNKSRKGPKSTRRKM